MFQLILPFQLDLPLEHPAFGRAPEGVVGRRLRHAAADAVQTGAGIDVAPSAKRRRRKVRAAPQE